MMKRGQVDRERAPFAREAVHVDASFMCFHGSPAESESESNTSLRSVISGAILLELVEDPMVVLVRNPLAVVLDRDHHLPRETDVTIAAPMSRRTISYLVWNSSR